MNIQEHADRLSRIPTLLVATDFDGTIAPIVDDPQAVEPHREALAALALLAELPRTHVAVISGRSLADLGALTRLPARVHLVGSHGSEFDPGFHSDLPAKARNLRARIAEALAPIAASAPGLSLEHKPASVAMHYRRAAPDAARAALSAVESGPAALPGVHVKHGKMVIELCAVRPDKGEALDTIRARCAAQAAIFIGDDLTDEDAFARLREPDLGIKIGDGPTAATERLPDTQAACRFLARLAEQRAAWLRADAAVPIEHHAMLSDQRTLALVTPTGRITWMCAPRADSAALFAELLGDDESGHFTVSADTAWIDQAYEPGSMTLRTRWKGLTVTDLLDCSNARPAQRAGRTDLIRIIEGRGIVRAVFAPRADFGRIPTRIIRTDDGLVVADTQDPIVLRSPGVNWIITDHAQHQTARADIPVGDEPVILELRYGTGDLTASRLSCTDRAQRTRRFWSDWADALEPPTSEHLRPDLVRRSALILKALCHAPTGAILAAGTTSLPEQIGGVRNWDYRYCWLRDAAMSAASLARLGSLTEAMDLLDWMVGVVEQAESPDRLHPLYTVAGHELGPEAEIGELSGYRGSRPVRVGNAAAHQVQLDVFGPIVALIDELLAHDAPLSTEHWRLVEAMVLAVERRWQDPDHGIWEIRKARRHHVHSKVMNWMTLDRAARIATRFHGRPRPEWLELRDRIRDDVIAQGYKPGVHAFTAAYDGEDLDAAALAVGLTGMLPPDDPRFVGTVEAVERTLRDGPTVYRYLADDGLPGHEGGFHLCAAWLAESYLLIGRRDDAQSLFEAIADLAGPTGLLTEEYLPSRQLALGNTPQAYSHLAVIDLAVALHRPT
jgi:trehalose 6-phosphate phosphatase